MSYTNVDITERRSEEELYLKNLLLEKELEYFKKELKYAKEKLKNIPESVIEYGYVDIIYDNDKEIRLIASPD